MRRRAILFGSGAAIAVVITVMAVAMVFGASNTPTVIGVSPNIGGPAGGTQVTVTGTNFKVSAVPVVSSVSFGGTQVTTSPCLPGTPPSNAPCFTVNSATQLVVWTPAHALGSVDVIVASSAPGAGSSAANPPADTFTYKLPPAISVVTPSTGPVTGSTTLTNPITIGGTDLDPVTSLSFGTTGVTTTPCGASSGGPPANAPCFSVLSKTQISAWPPAHAAGTVDVTATDSLGTSATNASDTYTYTAASPTVSGVAPSTGNTAGGDTVVVSGSNLNFATTVTFGATAVTNTPCSGSNAPCFTVDNQAQVGTPIHVTTPPGAAGTVDVTVTTAKGTSPTPSPAQFTYEPMPTVTGLSAQAGPTSGSTQVTITGTNFTGANYTTTSVSFGSTAITATPCAAGTPPANAPCFTVNSAASITAYTPAHAAGTVDVTVTTPGGTSATSSADQFAYAAAPAVTGLSPTSGPTAGGTSVTITGTSFKDPNGSLFTTTKVAVGGTDVTTTPCAVGVPPANAPCFTVSSATSITLWTPAHAAGRADVQVTTPAGTSGVVPADRFEYVQPAPTVSSVAPGTGPSAGSSQIAVTGTNFFSASSFTVTEVDFVASGAGGTTSATTTPCHAGSPPDNAPCFTVGSAASLTVWTPTHPPGTVDVEVVTNSGDLTTPVTSATSANDHYVFQQSAPTVTGLATTPATAPAPAGALGGGTQVSITGTNLGGTGFAVTKVSFGATDVTATPCGAGSPPGNSPCFTVVSPTAITVFSPAESAGTVDVTVTTVSTDGTSTQTSATSSADRFTYVAAPSVTSVTPTFGTTAGGTQVTVTGTNFEDAVPPVHYTSSMVSFWTTGVSAVCNPGSPPSPDNRPCFTVTSTTTITVWSPPHAGGPVHVMVTTPGGTSPANGTSDQYTFIAPTPAVSSLSPTAGPTTGATAVTITGSGLTGADTVSFGATAVTTTPCAAGTPPANAPCFTVTSDTGITAYSPSRAAGIVDVTVHTAGGTTAVHSGNPGDSFDYAPVPTVTSLSTATGPVGGGTQTTVTGTNFQDSSGNHLYTTSAVRFGSVAVTTTPCNAGTPPNPDNRPCFTVTSTTQITVWSPPQSGAGNEDVTVTTPGGTSLQNVHDVFAYAPQPAVSSVSPVSGPTTGATQITVTGTGFLDTTNTPARYTVQSVAFGGTAVTTACGGSPPTDGQGCFTVTSATSLTAYSPALPAGTVDITVTSAGGTSATNAGDRFGFTQPAPTVTQVTPTAGAAGGGTSVVVTGTNFSGPSFSASSVAFGAAAVTTTPCMAGSPPANAPCFTVGSATSITVWSPPHAAGQVDIVVSTQSSDTTITQSSATSPADLYSFAPVPTVTAVSPTTGTLSGATAVAVTGSGFTDPATTPEYSATRVSFGATDVTTTPCHAGTPPDNAPCFTVNSATSLLVYAPAHGAGTVDITVTTPGGTSGAGAADQFEYVQPAPTVAQVSPQTGPAAGGTAVSIVGTSFSGPSFAALIVSFGGTDVTAQPCGASTPPDNAPCFTIGSSTSITVWSPPHGAGQVDITVTTTSTDGTSAQTSATGPPDVFAYQPPPVIPPVSSARSPRGVSDGQGGVNAFWRGQDGNPYNDWYASGWHGPAPLPAGPSGSGATIPAGSVLEPVSASAGSENVFWIGADRNLYNDWFTPGIGWQGPGQITTGSGGSLPAANADPQPVSASQGAINVVYRGGDGRLYNVWTSGGGWAGPGALPNGTGGSAAGLGVVPSVVSAQPGSINVYFRGADGNVYNDYITQGTPWQGPAVLPGAGGGVLLPGDSDPRAVSTGSGTSVFWRGSDGNLYNDWYANGWFGPGQLASTRMAAGATPEPVFAGNGANVFWLGADGRLYNDWFSSAAGWNGPGALPGAPAMMSSPMPLSTHQGFVNVFYTGTDDFPYNDFISPSQSWGRGALPLGGPGTAPS